jgi:hypothetical protein
MNQEFPRPNPLGLLRRLSRIQTGFARSGQAANSTGTADLIGCLRARQPVRNAAVTIGLKRNDLKQSDNA